MQRFIIFSILISFFNISACQEDQNNKFVVDISHNFTQQDFNQHIIQVTFNNNCMIKSYIYESLWKNCCCMKYQIKNTLRYIYTSDKEILGSLYAILIDAESQYKFKPNNYNSFSKIYSPEEAKECFEKMINNPKAMEILNQIINN